MIEKVDYLFRFLTHFFKIRSKFRIHSPFVFNFYQSVLMKRTVFPEFLQIEKVRSDLLLRTRFIKKVDLGVRSLEFPYSQRFVRVRDIAKRSSVNRKEGEFLFRLARHYKPRNVLELGTAFGISTMYLAMGYRNCHIITLEGCTDTLHIAQHNFTRLGLGNIEEICGNFNEKLPEALKRLKTVDLVFFDGNHKQEATLQYFDECLNYIQNNTIFVFDDINYSREMKTAWENIRQHPLVTVSIDLFFMGIVFFRKALSKEDFILRF